MRLLKSILGLTLSSVLLSILLWTCLFYNNAYLKGPLPEIHLIFCADLMVYWLIKSLLNDFLLDFIKVFIRTLFRVWLLIFITFALTQSMNRVGIILSLTFIFGYFEGLLDIDKWLKQNNPLSQWISKNTRPSKGEHALKTIMLMSWVHIFCAVVVWMFSLFVDQL